MRVIACGSRTFSDRSVVNTVLNGLHPESGQSLTLIEGGATGADGFAGDWADAHEDVVHVRMPADWKAHGRGAGPIRNQDMLNRGPIHLVIAFVNKELTKSKGTFDMVQRARRANVPTWVVEVFPPRRFDS